MKKSGTAPPASPNLSNATVGLEERTESIRSTSSSGGAGLDDNFNSSPLTRSQRLAVEQRQNVLKRFDELLAQGKSRAEAAKELRLSVTTLWRWSSCRIVPATNLCGRPSALEKFNPPAEVLARVRQLQLTGKGNAAAWRTVTEDPICPPKLASHLRNAKTVSASLLAATKVTRRKATVLECAEFQHVIKSPEGRR